jgi:putative DNA primase/helicase
MERAGPAFVRKLISDSVTGDDVRGLVDQFVRATIPADAEAWALERWIELRGGTEPTEARQAIECVRLFIEQHGDARFASVDDADVRPVSNRAGYRKGGGAEREWWVLPEVWRAEICVGHDAQFVARVLARAGMLRTQAEGLQCRVRIGNITPRAYVVTAAILEGASDAP